MSEILWVLRTRSSWREMADEFGNWETAYKRYRHRGDTGLWPDILAALNREGGAESAEVSP